MSANTLGQIFRITSFGESHGGAVGVVVDGCPPGLALTEADIQKDLDRRRPGQSAITTPRKETDTIRILSGVFKEKTTGHPIMMMAENHDARPEDYEHMRQAFRPSHADFTYEEKYGIRDYRGSGRASARVTLGWVAAGAIAKKYLAEHFNTEFLSFVEQVGNIKATINADTVTAKSVESNIIRCPDQVAAKKMIRLIEKVREEKDSIGGIIRGIIRNVPRGLGEPVFGKLSADLAHAMLSINATKGFEYGSGFAGVSLRGSEHNDEFYKNKKGSILSRTNNSGGTLGGIATGMPITFRVAFKPVATIGKIQRTVSSDKRPVILEAAGRHDPCVLPRAVPIVDAMAAIVIMDHYLRHRAQNGSITD